MANFIDFREAYPPNKSLQFNRRWASQLRYRGQPFSPAVSELWSLGHMCTLMKHFTIRTITMILAQQAAMIFFMRVVRLDLFSSSGLSALIALIVGFGFYFVQKRNAGRKSDL